MNSSHALSASDVAYESVRTILRQLFRELQSNVDGVLEDADIDFLHDLRVANRRTRTVLSQIKGVLPASVVVTFSPEFKWLGVVTGSCRDLDVILLELGGYRRLSGVDGGALDTVRRFLEDSKRLEHRRVCAALRSTRFRRLIEGWDRFLESGTEDDAEPARASSPIIEVAGPVILKAHRRMRKRGAGLDADAPATVLHRLRIDGKKLRYLLEFFSDLYPPTLLSQFIKELKQLQDILGGFNDTVAQLAHVGEFAAQLEATGTEQGRIFSTAERLTDAIGERQRELRAECVDLFALFSSDDSRRRYRRTFNPHCS